MTSSYLDATLPICLDGNLYLDPRSSRSFGEQLSHSYCTAKPFPHIVIDNFLPSPLIEEIYNSFPTREIDTDIWYEEGYSGFHKRQVLPENCDRKMRIIFEFFNSAPILQFLEGLTKIDALIGDPYFKGGGFHEILSGGKLGIHADFRINEDLNLNRRINLLIYLNKNWSIDFGGNLEFWDSTMKFRVSEIAPIFNRCIIFNTDENSYHGHPDPLNTPIEKSRKSMALYYYTASKKIYEERSAYLTMYFARPSDSIDIQRQAVRLRQQNLIRDWIPPVAIRALSRLKNFVIRAG